MQASRHPFAKLTIHIVYLITTRVWNDAMQIALIIALSLHILSSVFWAGSSFTLARTGGVGGELLFGPQMGAAVIAVLTGAYLGQSVHEGTFGTPEKILAAGALT